MPATVLRACLLILCGVLGVLGAAEGDARIRSMAAAAAAAGPRIPMPAAHPRVAPAVGSIALTSVTVATPSDPTKVPRYGRIELLVSPSAMTSTKPYEPDPAVGGVDLTATFTSPASVAWTVPGYFDGTSWRVRFAPDSLGAWTCSVSMSDSSGTATLAGPGFTCIASESHGWVRVAGTRLAHADGTPFFAVGHNNGWQTDVEQPAFADMAAKGERLLSFWLYAPWNSGARGPIEQVDSGGAWTYNMAACQYVDGVVDRAEASGSFVLPSIWSHDELRGPSTPLHPWGTAHWAGNAYATICGINNAELFFDTGGGSSPQWKRQQAYLRYLTARWGSSSAVIGWVGLVEAEGTNGWVKTPTALATWCQSVRDWFVGNDPYRSAGGSHPIAFSTTNSVTWQRDASPSIDLLAFDSYGQKDSDLQVADAMAGELETMTSGSPIRPAFHSEFAGNLSLGATQPTHLHNAIWADLAAGSAIPALLWCDGQNVNPVPNPAPANLMTYPMLTDAANHGPEMRDQLQHLAAFAGLVPWVTASDQASSRSLIDSATMRIARAGSDRGYAWYFRDDGTVIAAGSTTLPLQFPQAGEYVVWWYDPWSGTEFQEPFLAASDGATPNILTAPASFADRHDLVVSWQLHNVPAAPTAMLVKVAPGARILITLPGAVISTLPATGTLYQAVDATTPGAAITTVPTTVSNSGLQVFYQAPAAPATTTIAVRVRDGRLISDPSTVTLDTTLIGTGPGGTTKINFDNGTGCGAGAAGMGVILGLLPLVGLRRRRR